MSASLHDPKHAYWCAVPWCPQYVRNHDRRAASPSGPSPAAGLPTRTFADAIRAGWHSPDMCSPAAGLDSERLFRVLWESPTYHRWANDKQPDQEQRFRDWANDIAAEYARLSRSGGEAP